MNQAGLTLRYNCINFINTDHYWAKTVSILLYQKNLVDVFGSTFILMSFKSNTFFHSLGLGSTVREKAKKNLSKRGKNW